MSSVWTRLIHLTLTTSTTSAQARSSGARWIDGIGSKMEGGYIWEREERSASLRHPRVRHVIQNFQGPSEPYSKWLVFTYYTAILTLSIQPYRLILVWFFYFVFVQLHLCLTSGRRAFLFHVTRAKRSADSGSGAGSTAWKRDQNQLI